MAWQAIVHDPSTAIGLKSRLQHLALQEGLIKGHVAGFAIDDERSLVLRQRGRSGPCISSDSFCDGISWMYIISYTGGNLCLPSLRCLLHLLHPGPEDQEAEVSEERAPSDPPLERNQLRSGLMVKRVVVEEDVSSAVQLLGKVWAN